MRFLREDPGDRLAAIRAAAPDVPLQVRARARDYPRRVASYHDVARA